MKRIVALLLMMHILSPARLWAAGGEDECKEGEMRNLMLVAWKSANMKFEKLLVSETLYMLTFTKSTDILMNEEGRPVASDFDKLIDLWPALEKQGPRIAVSAGNGKLFNFRFLQLSSGLEKDTVKVVASLDSSSAVPDTDNANVTVSSDPMPYIKHVAYLLVYYHKSALKAADPNLEEKVDTAIRTEIKAALSLTEEDKAEADAAARVLGESSALAIGRITNEALSRVDYMNKALANSLVPGRIVVTSIRELRFREDMMKGDDGTIDPMIYVRNMSTAVQFVGESMLEIDKKRIFQDRRQYKADLVTIMTGSTLAGGACGIGLTGVEKGLAFSVTKYRCSPFIAEVSYAHEIGHNFNLLHDRESGQSQSKPGSNFGYVNKTGKFFTVMAYGSACGSDCVGVPYYSNKDLKLQGFALGDSNNDASATLRENFPKVAGFYP